MATTPDVHYGIGVTVGSVIPTLRAIIQAAVGVDICCGMMAAKITLRAEAARTVSRKNFQSHTDAVMAAQADLVDTARTLKQVVCAKG